jgi:hypothetical protein
MSSSEADTTQLPGQGYRDLLGYLNFSDGTPGIRFQQSINELFAQDNAPADFSALQQRLLDLLAQLKESGEAAFQESGQATRVITFVLRDLIDAYRAHHRDLLFHLAPTDLFQPFFVTRMFEAALAAFSESNKPDLEAVTRSAIRRLNSFVGYRPVAVLENDRRAEVYDHERFCPIPLYLRDAGVGVGPAQELIESTLKFIGGLPEDMLGPAHFSLDRMDELSLDVRAHDHLHPVNKRTNYMFGEWDPEVIDTKGYYRRFVIRSIILDSLLDWLNDSTDSDFEERLFDASAVLAGTILMASSISGSGPQTYDSTVSLTSLLPVVARQRDYFYQTLLDTATGSRRRRLLAQATESRQPFGHVRHQLNMNLSRYGAWQVQHRHLSSLFAAMGFDEASREEAMVIPCSSARFESELLSRFMLIRRSTREGNYDQAARLVSEVMDLLHRGIHCGGIVDPWNILGFQGMFPLFFAREDAIPDNRVEVLLELVEQIFDACALVMTEAAAAGQTGAHESVRHHFNRLALEWDQYATTTVSDLPSIHGMESLNAADHVASALSAWRTAGEAAGDISFWREHVSRFESARSFSQVVSALLDRNDAVAAMGLLMQWLSQAEEVGLESGRHSIHSLLHRLLRTVMVSADDQQWQNLRRLFAFMEANAGVFWQVPSLNEFVDRHRKSGSDADEGEAVDLDNLFEEDDDDDDESALFSAAYDDVVFRDSADDGNDSDTLDEGYGPGTTEFEIIYRQLEPRLKFLHTAGSLWSTAAVELSRNPDENVTDSERAEYLRGWLATIRGFLSGLAELVREVRDHEIDVYSSDLEANIEYDIQMQSRFLLMQNTISTTVEFLMAERMLCAILQENEATEEKSRAFDQSLIAMLRAVLSRDAATVHSRFREFLLILRRRPLLYVPFEHGGQPGSILKARTLQAIIRLLLHQLPRLGLLEETYRLLQTAYRMERASRPLGQAVTEFDRLFRIGLSGSVDAILHSASNWKTDTPRQRRNVYRRIQRLLDAYRVLWATHSGSMRLSVVEELHDEDRAAEIRSFIETYGDDLFHTRMLTLGNARAIVHSGADSLIDELEQNVARFQPVRLIDDIQAGKISREDAAELMEFVYESVVDNFDIFLEYNTTTTHSDYGNRLYCLLDFLRLESFYDRFDWTNVPYQVAHESIIRFGSSELAAEVEEELADATREFAESLFDELIELESEYGVRLPTLHDHIGERIVGALTVNRMTARVVRCCPDLSDVTSEEAQENFDSLRDEVHDYMSDRIGSGIEPPQWMQQLARELDHAMEEKFGLVGESIQAGGFQKITQKELDRQLASLSDDESALY